MKTRFWIILVVVFHSVVSAQILHYRFDEGVGTTTTNSGSASNPLTLRNAVGTPTTALWGPPGSGPTSLAGDRALDLTTATGMGTPFSGPTAFLSALSSNVSLNQFTVTGWFRPDSETLDRAKLFLIQNGDNVMSVTGLSGGPAGARNRLRLIIDDGDSFPEVDEFGAFEAVWSAAKSWAFFAITYDGQHAPATVKFYSGSLVEAASLSSSNSTSSILFPLTGGSVCIGAELSNADPFKGYLDDFRLYGSTLTAVEVEHVRLSALPPPRLSIARVGASSGWITWTTNLTNYILEFATNLPAVDWRPVTNKLSVVGGRNSVIVQTSEAQRVYRLRSP